MTAQHRLGLPFAEPANIVRADGAGIVRDPRLLPKVALTQGEAVFKRGQNQVGALNDATNFLPAGYVTANTDSTNIVNVVSLTGSGFLYHLITHHFNNANASNTTKFTVTVDGIAYEFGPLTWATSYRLALGTFLNGAGLTGSVTDASLLSLPGTYQDEGHNARVGGGLAMNANPFLLSPQLIRAYGLPCLRFEKSLQISMLSSGTGAVATSNGGKTFIGYSLET